MEAENAAPITTTPDPTPAVTDNATLAPAAPDPAESAAPASTPSPDAFDEKSVPVELQGSFKGMKEHFEKKYAGYEQAVERAKALDELAKQPDFLEWYGNRGKPKAEPAKPEPELSPEEYANLLSDPKKFNAYLKDTISKQALELVAPRIQEHDTQIKVMEFRTEIEKFAEKNQDFWDLDAKGLIQPLITKYPGIAIRDAYRLAKFDSLQEDAIRKAHGIIDNKKAATTERNGVPTAAAKSAPKFKTRVEAMEWAMAEARAGREVPEVDFD